MRKTAATFMLIASIVWLITVMWGLIRGLSSGGGGDMPAEAILFLIAMIIIPICFLMASIFFLVDDER
tara:strand:- start:136 stop:339 length:204 start_codon:yes stop_codon:yes gene_type:complete